MQIFTFQFTPLRRQLSLLFSEREMKGLSAIQTSTTNNNNTKSKPDTTAYDAYCIPVKIIHVSERKEEAAMQMHISKQQKWVKIQQSSRHFFLQDMQHLGI